MSTTKKKVVRKVVRSSDTASHKARPSGATSLTPKKIYKQSPEKTVVKKKLMTTVADTMYKMGIGAKDDDIGPVKEKSQKGVIQGASQEIVSIQAIQDGIIKTTDGRYVCVLEFAPVDYLKQSHEEQEKIVQRFSSLFRKAPTSFGFKIISDKYSPREFISNIKQNCAKQDDPKRAACLANYIAHIMELSEKQSVVKRYFFEFQYSPSDDFEDTGRFEDIKQQMFEFRNQYIELLLDCGNIVLNFENNHDEMMTEQTAKICYYLYNRKSSKKISYEERVARIERDFDEYNRETGESKKYTYADVLAPKGLYLDSKKYVYCDGEYYGFLGILGNKYPGQCEAGWTTIFNDDVNNVDVDIRFQKLPKDWVKRGLKFYVQDARHNARQKSYSNDMDAAQSAQEKYENGMTIYNRLHSSDDLFNMELTLIFRCETELQLGEQMRSFKKNYKEIMTFDDGYLNAEQYFKACVPPTLTYTAVLGRLKHNMTSTSAGFTYPFCGLESNDINGYLLGTQNNGSPAIIDNFNTNKYINGHCVILGSSGAGKTFTEQTIGGRCCLNGMRVHFIIPAKGFEYKNGCERNNGVYIKLGPGSYDGHHDCINVLAIQPEDTNKNLSDDIDPEALKDNSKSLLGKKLNSVIVWFQMLSTQSEIPRQHQNIITSMLRDIYMQHGITEDNSSIYNSDGTLKEMPIISELYDAMVNYEGATQTVTDAIHEEAAFLDPFVSGAYTVMNGQTNVDLNSDYTVYDVDENNIEKDLLPSFLYLAFDCVYSKSKSDSSTRDIIILDELWKMLAQEACASQIQNAILLARSYYTSIIVATQEIGAFLGAAHGYGISVLNNSEIKMYMKTKEMDLKLLSEHLNISPEDQQMILKLKRGYVLMKSSNEKMVIHVSTTPQEYWAYNTDHSKTK